MIGSSDELGTALLDFTTATVEALAAAHLPEWRIPRTFGGHRVDADVRADLLYTLTHLAAGGVRTIAGDPIETVIRHQLARVDGRATHTFFSYRVAETLLRRGPFAGNPLLADCDNAAREQLAVAVDSRDWIDLLTQGVLPRNYAAVLSRCELARVQLGLADDETILDDLVGRLRALLGEEPVGYLDDSNDHSGRYDIYTADIWLFCEPLADRIGPDWEEGTRRALALVDTLVGVDGAAIPWGRSTGVLATALTVELAALAVTSGTARAPAWVRHGIEALRATTARFDADGVVDAHRHRDQDGYRAPFRRLQLTLDVLGKLAWAGATLRGLPEPVDASLPERAATDELIRFEPDRGAGVWVHANPARRVVVPFVGVTRSHYLPVPHAPGTFEAPVDNEQVVWAPLVISRLRRATTGELPATLTTAPDAVTAHWDGLAVTGRGLDGAVPESVAGSCTTTYRVDRRTVVVEHDLTVDDPVEAVALQVPETARAPLHVHFECDTPHAITTVTVDGIAEWASPYSGLVRVHQLDVDPVARVQLRARVTPKLRVASTAHGHWYHRLLYAPVADRVLDLPAPIGPLGDRSVDLADVELLHLHWPEWFGFDDPATHERLIATLADRGIPVVWTAHNLTPHDRKPEVYDAIYQRWAETIDAVIHHSVWGRDRMLARYRFRADCRHEVIPHDHFGDLWPAATSLTRADAEARLGLSPATIRIGLVGAPRVDKRVGEFLEAVTCCARPDVQVVCWSLALGDVAPDDPRVAVAEPYRGADEATYGTRLAACDALAFPFDPEGEMLATGTIADAIGLGIPALVSDWPFLTQMLDGAGIPMGHTVATMTAALDALTTDRLDAARTAMAALRPSYDWGPLAARTVDLFERVALAEP
ncbi:MAG: hypothetical protein ACXVJX_12120 [Acidimicrobiia bacterium]